MEESKANFAKPLVKRKEEDDDDFDIIKKKPVDP
jgi:hypothetical protein